MHKYKVSEWIPKSRGYQDAINQHVEVRVTLQFDNFQLPHDATEFRTAGPYSSFYYKMPNLQGLNDNFSNNQIQDSAVFMISNESERAYRSYRETKLKYLKVASLNPSLPKPNLPDCIGLTFY